MTAAAAAPEVTSRCLPISPPLLCATSTRPAAGAGVAASVRARRSEISVDVPPVDAEAVHDADPVTGR